MKYFFFVIVFVIITLQPLNAQNKVIDSIENLIKNEPSDTTRILLIIDLASIYQFNNADTALTLIDEAISLSKKIDFTRGELRAQARKGELQHLRGEYPQALETELTVIEQSEKYKHPDIEAEGLTFLATIYLDLAEYRMAQHYLFRAKKNL